MKHTLFLSLEEVLELHGVLIKKFGGIDGVRDLGLLQSALMRPQTGYYKTLSLQAAALFQSLATNYVFIDGNKRVAFAATLIFLRMNGYSSGVKACEGERFIVESVIQKKINLDQISDWLENRMIKLIK